MEEQKNTSWRSIEESASSDEMHRLRRAEEERRRRRRRWLRGPLGSWLALVGFALPFMTVAIEKCSFDGGSEVIVVTDSIYGYELVTGGSVAVAGPVDDVAGLIDMSGGGGRGDINPQPLAMAALAAAVAGAVLGFRRKKPTNRDASATITIAGVVAFFGIAALLALRWSLGGHLLDTGTFIVWGIGSNVMFVGFLWAGVASHLKAVHADDAVGLVATNVMVGAFFVAASVTGPLATGLSLAVGTAVLAVNVIVITAKWLFRSARARSSPNP